MAAVLLRLEDGVPAYSLHDPTRHVGFKFRFTITRERVMPGRVCIFAVEIVPPLSFLSPVRNKLGLRNSRWGSVELR